MDEAIVWVTCHIAPPSGDSAHRSRAAPGLPLSSSSAQVTAIRVDSWSMTTGAYGTGSAPMSRLATVIASPQVPLVRWRTTTSSSVVQATATRDPRTAVETRPSDSLPTVEVVPQVEPRSLDTRVLTVPDVSDTHVTATVEPLTATEGRPA